MPSAENLNLVDAGVADGDPEPAGALLFSTLCRRGRRAAAVVGGGAARLIGIGSKLMLITRTRLAIMRELLLGLGE